MGEVGAERRVIDNPISGERIVIRTSAAETDGALLAFDLYLPPGGHVPAGHVHPIQEERFTVVSGTWRFRFGRRTILAEAGQTVTVPPGAAHWFGNIGDTEAQAHVEVRPALRMEELLETSEDLAHKAQADGRLLPSINELAVMLLEFERELAVPHVPARLARCALRSLAWFQKRRRPAIVAKPAEP